MFRFRTHEIFRLAALSLIALALAAPAAAAPKDGSPGRGRGKGPVPENGSYQRLKVAGYYSGSGAATVAGASVKITATVSDPAGNSHTLTSGPLQRKDNHFFGPGTLGAEAVEIDGRVDPSDEEDDETAKGKGPPQRVLKSGRILFNFRVNATGRGGRGVGEKTNAAPPTKNGGNNGNNGNAGDGNNGKPVKKT